MKRWGVVITLFYALIVALLIAPGAMLLIGEATRSPLECLRLLSHEWLAWVWLGMLICGEALLLTVSVDTSMKRLKPRQHIAISITAAALMIALLTCAGALSLLAGVLGDKFGEGPAGWFLDSQVKLLVWVLILWAVWGIVFAVYVASGRSRMERPLDGLLKGSILELLIAVPAHIIARNRHDCSAPIATSFGIATGLAVMLLCFGPGVFFLYKERLARYRTSRTDAS